MDRLSQDIGHVVRGGTLDPVTFANVPLLLCIVALLACLMPATRAASVDPITTLRQ